MNHSGVLIKHKVFHACVGVFLPRLAKQHHEYNPFDLLNVDVVCFQR